MKISCYESVKSANPQVLTWEKFLSLTESQNVKRIASKVQQAVKAGDRAQKDALKKKLPIATWQAFFHGSRKNEDAMPTGLFMLDVDHLKELPEKVYAEKIAGKVKDLGIVVVHKTISCEGIRIVAFCRPEFSSLVDNQRWLANELMLEFDPACKDFARSSFLVPFEYFFYLQAEIFASDFKAPYTLNNTNTPQSTTPSPHTQTATIAPTPNASTQRTYKGFALLDIATTWLKEFHGGFPEEGERNTVLFQLAGQMRYICDFRPEVVAANIPSCGLDPTEIMSLCQSACGGTRQRTIPAGIRKAISILKGEDSETPISDIEVIETPQRPLLPPIFREFCDIAPEDFKDAVVLCLLPMLGTLGSRLRGQYLNGKWETPSFMVALEAPQASGKSFIEDVAAVCLKPIADKDESERDKERDFEEQVKIMKASGANTKSERERIREFMKDKPTPIIRKMPATTSITKLLIRMQNAQGLHLFAMAVEIDTVAKAFKRGFSNLSDLLRCSFDNSEFGQEYASETSFSGTVRVYYNTLYSGTPAAMRRFYTNSEDGTMSRTLFVTLPDQFGKVMPIWGKFNLQTTEKIQQLLQKLYEVSIQGDEIKNVVRLEMEEVNQALQQWNEQQRLLSIETGDRTRNTFARRCAEVGFRAAMLAQWLWSCEEEDTPKKVCDFAIWVAEMMLRQFLLRIDLNTDDASVGNLFARNVYSSLPDEFTRSTLKSKLVELGFKSPASKVLSRWKSAGVIQMKDKYNAELITKTHINEEN